MPKGWQAQGWPKFFYAISLFFEALTTSPGSCSVPGAKTPTILTAVIKKVGIITTET